MFRLLLFTLTLMLFGHVWASEKSFDVHGAKLAITKELQAKNFLKVATCREVVNSFLLSEGLPELGTNSRRQWLGRIDRRRQGDSLPTIIDEARDPLMKVRTTLSSRVDSDRQTLKILVIRSREDSPRGVLRSEILFRVSSHQGGQSCNMLSSSFSFEDKVNGVPSTDLLRTEDCLEPFIDVRYLFKLPNPADKQVSGWIEKDCALAARYADAIR